MMEIWFNTTILTMPEADQCPERVKDDRSIDDAVHEELSEVLDNRYAALVELEDVFLQYTKLARWYEKGEAHFHAYPDVLHDLIHNFDTKLWMIPL